jgi:cobalt/nickel transport system permease protein
MPAGAWRALAVLGIVIALGVWSARLPVSALARRVGQAVPFFLLPALALPISVPGPTAFEFGRLTLSEPGLMRAAEIVARATLAVSAVAVVVSITRSTDLLRGLDGLPLPRLVKSSLSLGYRYVYLLNDELDRTARAIRSRMGDASRLRLWRARASTLAHLFLRAHDRGTRIHAAMLSRGYHDRLPTLQPAATVSPVWTLAIAGLFAVIWLGGLMEAMV